MPPLWDHTPPHSCARGHRGVQRGFLVTWEPTLPPPLHPAQLPLLCRPGVQEGRGHAVPLTHVDPCRVHEGCHVLDSSFLLSTYLPFHRSPIFSLHLLSVPLCYEWTPISSSFTLLQVLIRHVILTFPCESL